jgi:hypothetical protein
VKRNVKVTPALLSGLINAAGRLSAHYYLQADDFRRHCQFDLATNTTRVADELAELANDGWALLGGQPVDYNEARRHSV